MREYRRKGRIGTLQFHRLLHLFLAGVWVKAFKSHSLTKVNRFPSIGMSTEEANAPVWDPVRQIYVGGKLPETHDIQDLIDKNNGYLRLFGYGSLCWNPGTGALSKSGVTSTLGKAQGYKRCWAQKSTDHRGVPEFPGIVCTLLTDKEVDDVHKSVDSSFESLREEPTMTEGVIYLIPPDLVSECLEELDFREKGGYARDIITVVEDETEEIHQALLYRGTPENPAFWRRALLDLSFAAAVMSVATGPSGKNDYYLNSLDEFLTKAATIAAKNDDTAALAQTVHKIQDSEVDLHFLFGSGSNQHNQLLLASSNNAAGLRNGEDALDRKEIVLATASLASGKATGSDDINSVYAGGGHSAAVLESGRIILWGWNDSRQLGTCSSVQGFPVALQSVLGGDLRVVSASLGFSHSAVIEQGTQRLYCFGANDRGQVNGSLCSGPVEKPVNPQCLSSDRVLQVSAGLFHTGCITESGELVVFGCGRFGQSGSKRIPVDEDSFVWQTRWKPDDARLVHVACGRRHTVVVDEIGRVWSAGENKYNQLGRPIGSMKKDENFSQVHDLVGIATPQDECRVFCGWSHTILEVLKGSTSQRLYYGWGRNDKGQLGLGNCRENVETPTLLFQGFDVQQVDCGSESTMVVDSSGRILGCGWNEHGNLGIGSDIDTSVLTECLGAPVVSPHGGSSVVMAAGGAHVLVARKRS